MLTDLAQDLAKAEVIDLRMKRYIWRDTVSPLITEDIIEEHRANPLGKHSVHLDMVLTFLRDDPVPDEPRLVVVIVKPEEQWCIGEFSRRPGDTIYCRPTIYTSVDDIEHAIFLERLDLVFDRYGRENVPATVQEAIGKEHRHG